MYKIPIQTRRQSVLNWIGMDVTQTQINPLTSDTLNCENWKTMTECSLCNKPINKKKKEKMLCKYCFNCKSGINCTSCTQKMSQEDKFNCPYCRTEINKTQIQGQLQIPYQLVNPHQIEYPPIQFQASAYSYGYLYIHEQEFPTFPRRSFGGETPPYYHKQDHQITQNSSNRWRYQKNKKNNYENTNNSSYKNTNKNSNSYKNTNNSYKNTKR